MSMLKNYHFSHLTENTIFVTPEWSCRTSGKIVTLAFAYHCYYLSCVAVFLPSFLGIRSKFRTDDVQNFTLNLATSILLLYEKVDFFEYLIQSFKSTIYYKLSRYHRLKYKIKRPEINVTIFPTKGEISKTLSR